MGFRAFPRGGSFLWLKAMATMPNLVGLNYRVAIATLIEADIIPNDGSVPAKLAKGVPTVGYFAPWPIAINWQKGKPEATVTVQYPAAGQPVTVTSSIPVNASYTPPITLTVNAPTVGVSNQFTAGAFS
jgi:beta-lactam-binding protein with PASTA domain